MGAPFSSLNVLNVRSAGRFLNPISELNVTMKGILEVRSTNTLAEVNSINILAVYANTFRNQNGRRGTECSTIVSVKIDVQNRTFLGLLAIQFCELVYFMWAVNRGWKFYRIRTC